MLVNLHALTVNHDAPLSVNPLSELPDRLRQAETRRTPLRRAGVRRHGQGSPYVGIRLADATLKLPTINLARVDTIMRVPQGHGEVVGLALRASQMACSRGPRSGPGGRRGRNLAKVLSLTPRIRPCQQIS